MDEIVKGKVPVPVVAKIYGKSQSLVRVGIVAGWLDLGFAIRRGEKVTDVKKIGSQFGRIDYYISPKKLYEETGYLWDGKEGRNEKKSIQK